MTLPVSGAISLNDVNVELRLSGTTTISLNQTNVRELAGVPSGAISMQNLQGKQYRVAVSHTFTTNTANATLNLSSISGYIAGISDITVTVNTGIYLYATSVLNSGLALTGGASGDTLTIVNNGFIMGQGGNGGNGGTNAVGTVGSPGGPALSIPIPTTINNTNPVAYIGGGGGGGGGGRGNGPGPSNGWASGGGGGAGGGSSGQPRETAGSVGAILAGGAIGQPGVATPTNDAGTGWSVLGSGSGGRIFPGVGGATPYPFSGIDPEYGPYTGTSDGGSGGGAGGASGRSRSRTSGKSPSSISPGKAGGSGSSAGANATPGTGPSPGAFAGGGGGGWGAPGGTGSVAAGTGGSAVTLNGNSVTWTSGNTTRVYGAVS